SSFNAPRVSSVALSLLIRSPCVLQVYPKVRYAMIPSMPRAISLNTPIEDLHNFRIARLGDQLSHKLAVPLAAHANQRNAAKVTVEDLLNYLPMRYEDRSHPAAISDLMDQMEASLELLVLRAHGYEVRKGYGRGRLFIFEVKAYDAGKTGREVIV